MPTALVVDDSAAMRRIQSKALENGGWEVTAVTSGQEALDVLQQTGPRDLVITDWYMPGMTGIELVRSIRGNPALAKVRILIVTSDGTISNVQHALDAGADDFLMKPFTATTLVERAVMIVSGQP
jgi:two-component system chemotaxis response regulator CheY